MRRSTKTRGATLGAILLVAGLVGGCTGEEPPEDEASTAAPESTEDPTDDPTDDSAEGATDPTGPLTAQQVCAELYVGGGEPLEEEVGNALVAASKGMDQVVAGQMTAVGVQLRTLETNAPDEFTAAIQQVRVPFVQLQEHFDMGGSDTVELDIGSARAGLGDLRGLCADEGYAFPS
ncbi:hypothetical protein [Oerskovia flava]|uniref:hypothetical protein n=1 Tax=Oerskovia flava TaxID=2986422 RepID=UPI00224002A3|nr:hypothetical protein [Oerskovia sp. JB1-3-2]